MPDRGEVGADFYLLVYLAIGASSFHTNLPEPFIATYAGVSCHPVFLKSFNSKKKDSIRRK